MTETTTSSPPAGPEALVFDPPLEVYDVNEDNVVMLEPLFELRVNQRVAIENPWSDGDEYAIGIIRGAEGQWMLDIGKSLGQLELGDEGWVCNGLATLSAIAQGLAIEAGGVPPGPQKFTTRLLKKTGKKSGKGKRGA